MTGARLRSRGHAALTAARDRALLLADAARPYRPMRGGARRLEDEYRAGTWDYLTGDEELARFGVVAAYCRRFGAAGNILEIGCGEGLLAERLGTSEARRFVGVDVAPTAVARARALNLPGAMFEVAEADAFDPEASFDLIVFHEMLEYLDDPSATVRRYEQWLTPEGSFVVSQFRATDNVRTRRIWRALHARYAVRAHARVTTAPRLWWTIEVLTPPGPRW